MAMKGGENVGRAESVSLKRKLRGPLNMLLLGKTRSRSEGEEPLEVVENETTVRHSDTTVERGADLKKFSGLEGEAPTHRNLQGALQKQEEVQVVEEVLLGAHLHQKYTEESRETTRAAARFRGGASVTRQES